MASLNFCKSCGFNFTSASVHDAHRVSNVKDDYTTRRCRIESEMLAKGWSLNSQEQVRTILEGKPVIKTIPTWSIPLTDEQRAYFDALNAKRSSV